MKKKFMNLAVLAILLGGVQTASAQNWVNAPQTHLGVRAGISDTYTLADDWDGDYCSKDLVGPVLGVAFDTKIAKLPFYIETGAYYMNRGQKYKVDGYHDYYGPSSTWTENNNSVLIPVLFSYHAYINPTMSFQPFMGPFVSFGLEDDEVDYGVRMGCGFNVKQFYVNMGLDVGLRSDFDTHEGNVSSFFMTIGWNFLGKR